MSRRDFLRNKIFRRTRLEPAPVDSGLSLPCRLWTGPTSGTGRGGRYGRMCVDGATMAVHIVIWVIENGPIPPRKQIDHLCMRRDCCEETHLEMITHKKNQRRRALAARKRKENESRDHTGPTRHREDHDIAEDG